MQLKRVVITGVGAVSPLGDNVSSLMQGIRQGNSAVKYMDGWDEYIGLNSLVAAPVELRNQNLISRESRRSMGRMSIMAAQATEQVLSDANFDRALLATGTVGCIIGSTSGGAESLYKTYEALIPGKNLENLDAMKVFQCISHSAVMNVTKHFKINGYALATSAACASGLQAIGCGYDLIRLGSQNLMLCGGAEELHPMATGSFDILYATSTKYNKTPQKTPRPFDAERDGLVCGEGCGMVCLEEYEHAKKRNAKIYAEILGWHTCGSGKHISESDKGSIVFCIKNALSNANVQPGDVDYINAHATATLQGDKEESQAIREVFGDSVPVSSLKGYIGHTLGASGAIELIVSLNMISEEIIYPTLNLETVSEDCKGIYHVMKPLRRNLKILMKNSCAFGGISATLVLKKYS